MFFVFPLISSGFIFSATEHQDNPTLTHDSDSSSEEDSDSEPAGDSESSDDSEPAGGSDDDKSDDDESNDSPQPLRLRLRRLAK